MSTTCVYNSFCYPFVLKSKTAFPLLFSWDFTASHARSTTRLSATSDKRSLVLLASLLVLAPPSRILAHRAYVGGYTPLSSFEAAGCVLWELLTTPFFHSRSFTTQRRTIGVYQELTIDIDHSGCSLYLQVKGLTYVYV